MNLRLLADENVYREIVEAIRTHGFDVKTADELGAAGAGDEEILDLARAEKRLLVTFDRDFSDVRYLPRDVPGVIVLRLHRLTIERCAKRVAHALHTLGLKKLVHALIIVTPTATRRRSLRAGKTRETRYPV